MDSLEIRLQSLDLKLTTLENDKKMLKEEAETLQIKAELLRVRARGIEILSAEILKEGTEILCQIKFLAENNELGELRQKLLQALEPLRKHFLDKQHM
jgi:hypothetical protein